MAEAVIAGIAGEIITNLVPQALEKVGKLWGVKHELKALRDTVSMLRPVLDHAEEQSHQIHHIRVWVEELKDAFYEAQDVLEEFNIEAMRRELRGHNEMIKEVRTFFSSSNQLAFKLKMSDKVRAVRERIEAIKADRGFHLNERPVDSRAERERRKRETHSFIREVDIIGRDDDKKKVMEFLLDSDVKEDVSILPIVGIGGLGKTALAQFVYNDEMVTKHFALKMWVCVSDDFDLKKLVKNMIACAKKEAPSKDELEQLQSTLRAEIDGKRYLLVLDDFWDKELETWLRLKTLLVGGARGSKILITTRLPLVAEITSTAPPHFLEDLSESSSFDLLMKMAFPKEDESQDPEMLDIGKEIARKCPGVPLFVRTVGSLLFLKKTKREWLHFKDNELPDVSQREDGIKSILKLSYDHLPSHLKQCFAFCSLFPKDYEIKKQTLVDLWMAEGFIQQSNRSQHLEDTADEYFEYLLRSNFFQDYREDEETCKMHDLMHDLACLVAGTECWVAGDDKQSIHKRTRHIYVDDLPISRLKANPLRTLLFAMPRERSEVDLHQLIHSFKRLRILDLYDKDFEKVPRSICKLKYLTYLDLSGNYKLKRLPNSITRLQNLQTLNLGGCDHLEELPRDIRKLVSLRNLDIVGCRELGYMPSGLGQLSSLHRLTRFILPKDKALAKNCCGLGELDGLNNIRGSLRIENLGSVTDAEAESSAANLIGKHSLESLQLEWGDFDTNDAVIGNRDEAILDGLMPHSNLQKLSISGYKGESFPRWMMDSLGSSLPNLVEVGFSSCERCKHLPPLGQLPHLKSLWMLELTELEYIESDHLSTLTASLPSLLELSVGNCGNLTAMPLTPRLEVLRLRKVNPELINMMFGLNKLERLIIRGVEFLEYLPEGCLKSLTSLKSLDIMSCPQLTSLSLGIQHLSNLVKLSIEDCEELDLCLDESGNILDFHGLHSLRSLQISALPKLESLPRWLLRLTNLERLYISTCSNLKALPEQIEALQSLQWLEIFDCPSLTSLPEQIEALQSLQQLHIYNCHSFTSLPEQIEALQSLRQLHIYNCPSLTSLPEQVEALQSLQRLHIYNCPSLTSLPEGMRRLASLTHLRITGCPELEERCKKDAGEDWHKIAHIPNITIKPFPFSEDS